MFDHIFQRHIRYAAFSARQQAFPFQLFPGEIFVRFPRQNKGSVALGHLGKHLHVILFALVVNIDTSLRTGKTDINAAGKHSSHDFIGALTVAQFQFQAFFFKESQLDSRILRGVKYRMGHLAYRDFLQFFLCAATGKNPHDQHSRTEKGKQFAHSFLHRDTPSKINFYGSFSG